jgi:hydroxymethylbilane synthase
VTERLRPPLRLATRRSPLAQAQARWVADQIERTGIGPVELVGITSQGDLSDGPLAQIGGTGVFVTALREAVLAGVVDAAVHSLKDLPVVPDERLLLAAVPVREDPSDVLVARDAHTLDELPIGARVGTGSPRRAMQLRILRPDLDVVDVRGNVDTRVTHVHEGRLDAVVLARAGLARLGRLDAVSEVFSFERMLPAPGQGALAVECRQPASTLPADLEHGDGAETRTAQVVLALRRIDDPISRACVTAERAVLETLEAGCSAPIGALAVVDDANLREHGELVLHAVVGTPEGTAARLSRHGSVHDSVGLGRGLAQQLLQAGAPGADRVWGVRVQ